MPVEARMVYSDGREDELPIILAGKDQTITDFKPPRRDVSICCNINDKGGSIVESAGRVPEFGATEKNTKTILYILRRLQDFSEGQSSKPEPMVNDRGETYRLIATHTTPNQSS